MFRRVLIANRAAIACRIIRTCRRMGVESVAVRSPAEPNALHAALADVAVDLPEVASPVAGYLDIDAIIDAARRTGADAIHPGYGFLSENPDFARRLRRRRNRLHRPAARRHQRRGQQAGGADPAHRRRRADADGSGRAAR